MNYYRVGEALACKGLSDDLVDIIYQLVGDTNVFKSVRQQNREDGIYFISFTQKYDSKWWRMLMLELTPEVQTTRHLLKFNMMKKSARNRFPNLSTSEAISLLKKKDSSWKGVRKRNYVIFICPMCHCIIVGTKYLTDIHMRKPSHIANVRSYPGSSQRTTFPDRIRCNQWRRKVFKELKDAFVDLCKSKNKPVDILTNNSEYTSTNGLENLFARHFRVSTLICD